MPFVLGKQPPAPPAPMHAKLSRAAAYSPRSRAAYNNGGLGFWPFSSSAADGAARLLKWRQAVQTRGNVATVMPSQGGAFAGQLAERLDAAKLPAGKVPAAPAIKVGVFWYVPAPQELRTIYAAQGAANTRAIETQAIVERVQGLPAAVIGAAGNTGRTVVSAVTGIPKWAIPVLIVGGIGYVLYTALGGVRMLRPGQRDSRD